MYSPICNIYIGDLHFKGVTSMQINKSWRNKTDKCTITLPRALHTEGGQVLKDVIKAGQSVQVYLGYIGPIDPNTKQREQATYTEFTGYVTHITPSVPMVIECEDQMYRLKTGSYTRSWANASLDDIIQYIYDGEYSTFGDIKVGAFTINKATPAAVLAELEKIMGLRSFFRNGVLVIGKPYDPEHQSRHIYHFNKNVISNDLEYKTKDDIKLKVKATSLIPTGERIEIELGDKDGEERTLTYFNLNKETLENRARSEMQALAFEGYRGGLVAFGYPRVQHGDIVELYGYTVIPTDGEEVQDLTGAYFVDEVAITYADQSYRRAVKLGPKADAGILDFKGTKVVAGV